MLSNGLGSVRDYMQARLTPQRGLGTCGVLKPGYNYSSNTKFFQRRMLGAFDIMVMPSQRANLVSNSLKMGHYHCLNLGEFHQ